MINLNDKLLQEVNEYELWLCTHVAKRMNENGAFPSNETLCKDTGWSLNTLQKHKKSLIAKKILICEKRFRDRGGQTSNNYRLASKYIKKFTETPKENTPTQDLGMHFLDTQDLSRQHTQKICSPPAQFLGIPPTQNLGNEVLVNLSINQSNPFSLSIQKPESENLQPKNETEPTQEVPAVDVTTLNESVRSYHRVQRDSFLMQMKGDYVLLEALARKTMLTSEQIFDAAADFADDKIAIDQFLYPKYKDFKGHFYNWMLLNYQKIIKSLNKKQNGATKLLEESENSIEALARRILA